VKLFRSRNPDKYLWCSSMEKALELLGCNPEMLFELSEEIIMEVEDGKETAEHHD
jgi:hypothetical protein